MSDRHGLPIEDATFPSNHGCGAQLVSSAMRSIEASEGRSIGPWTTRTLCSQNACGQFDVSAMSVRCSAMSARCQCDVSAMSVQSVEDREDARPASGTRIDRSIESFRALDLARRRDESSSVDSERRLEWPGAQLAECGVSNP